MLDFRWIQYNSLDFKLSNIKKVINKAISSKISLKVGTHLKKETDMSRFVRELILMYNVFELRYVSLVWCRI